MLPVGLLLRVGKFPEEMFRDFSVGFRIQDPGGIQTYQRRYNTTIEITFASKVNYLFKRYLKVNLAVDLTLIQCFNANVYQLW